MQLHLACDPPGPRIIDECTYPAANRTSYRSNHAAIVHARARSRVVARKDAGSDLTRFLLKVFENGPPSELLFLPRIDPWSTQFALRYYSQTPTGLAPDQILRFPLRLRKVPLLNPPQKVRLPKPRLQHRCLGHRHPR